MNMCTLWIFLIRLYHLAYLMLKIKRFHQILWKFSSCKKKDAVKQKFEGKRKFKTHFEIVITQYEHKIVKDKPIIQIFTTIYIQI